MYDGGAYGTTFGIQQYGDARKLSAVVPRTGIDGEWPIKLAAIKIDH